MTDPKTLSDEELLSAYEHTDGVPGHSDGDALLEEIKRRGLDV